MPVELVLCIVLPLALRTILMHFKWLTVGLYLRWGRLFLDDFRFLWCSLRPPWWRLWWCNGVIYCVIKLSDVSLYAYSLCILRCHRIETRIWLKLLLSNLLIVFDQICVLRREITLGIRSWKCLPVTAEGLFDGHTLCGSHQQSLAIQKYLARWLFLLWPHPVNLLAIMFRVTLISESLMRPFRFHDLLLLSVFEPVVESGIKNWILTGLISACFHFYI